MKRYGKIDLEGNEMVNVAFENLAPAPGSPATGRVYFKSTDAVVQVYDGSNWKDLWSPDDDFYNNLPNENSTAGIDSILIYDDSATTYKRQTKDDFFQNIDGYLPPPVSPYGSNRNVQYNSNGDFWSDDDFQWSLSNYLYINRSHTVQWVEDLQPGNPVLQVNNMDTTAGNKYAAIEFVAKYSASYTSRAYIVASTMTLSTGTTLNFQVQDDLGDFWSPLLIRSNEGAVLQDNNGVWKFYVTPVGATVMGDLIVNDSGVNTVRLQSTTSSDVYYELEDNGGTRGIFGWDVSESLLKFNYGALANSHFTMNSSGRIGMGGVPDSSAILRIGGNELIEYSKSTSYVQLCINNTYITGASRVILGGNNGAYYCSFFKDSAEGGIGDSNYTGVYVMSWGSTYINIGHDHLDVSTARVRIGGDLASGYAASFLNDGNNANRWGIKIGCGADVQSTGIHYYLRGYAGSTATEEGGLRNNAGTFQIYQVSDERKKIEIIDTTIKADKILRALHVKDFKKIGGSGIKSKKQVGWIAQEVAKVYKPMHAYIKDSDLHTISPMDLIPVLHRGWQIHDNEITRLKREVVTLKKKLNEKVR